MAEIKKLFRDTNQRAEVIRMVIFWLKEEGFVEPILDDDGVILADVIAETDLIPAEFKPVVDFLIEICYPNSTNRFDVREMFTNTNLPLRQRMKYLFSAMFEDHVEIDYLIAEYKFQSYEPKEIE